MNKSLLNRLLEYYQISYDKYLELNKDVDLSNFSDDRNFEDIDSAVKLVKEVIANKGKIIVYGDYDADGVMGTSILIKMFEYLGVIADYYIPNRYIDGYGLNLNHAKEYVNKYDLVITVDNGITANEAINYLKDNGVKTLILDHHEAGDKLPNADAICHPIISHFGEVSSSGAFTAFIYSINLLNRVDKYLATLAAISLVSDMMPLVDYNRYLLRAVFKDYIPGEFLAVSLLADNEMLDENVIGMKVAPRINSIGRLTEDKSINDIVKYFTSSDKDFILNYHSHIIDTNEERKSISKIDINDVEINPESCAIVIKGDYKEGIIGLIANSVMNKYHKPVIVFTSSIDNSLKGSARAPEGYNIVKVFNELSDLLLTSGGHASAAGCSIKEEDFETFKNKVENLFSNTEVEKVSHPYIDILINELNFENIDLINSFSPFGEGWPTPLFRLRHIRIDSLMYSKDHKHIISPIGNKQKLVFFNYDPSLLKDKKYIDIIGVLAKKEYKGNYYVEFNGKEFLDTEN